MTICKAAGLYLLTEALDTIVCVHANLLMQRAGNSHNHKADQRSLVPGLLSGQLSASYIEISKYNYYYIILKLLLTM